MKIKYLFNFIVVAIFIGMATGCGEKDLYDPNYGKEPVKGPEEYFGFETRGDVSLNVNYALPGFAALIEVYDIDPMEIVGNTPVKKQGVEALFKIYTDESGKFNGKMNIPTSVKSVYLYTESWGLPRCMSLEVKDGMVNFNMADLGASTVKTKNNTRYYDFQGTVPYVLNRNANLYSLCKWGEGGSLNSEYMSLETQVGDETVGSLTQRLKNFFNPDGIPNVDNMHLVTQSEVTNITVTQDGTALDVVFLNRDAKYNNSFGYYYYKTSEGANMSNMKKYIVFPNVSFSVYEGQLPILKCGSKVRLLYFDEQGNAKKEFPAGYTVGWFIYADGYNQNENEIDTDKQVVSGFTNLLASNQVFGQQRQNFVSVKDEKSGKVIIGVEDGANNSYCDLLFYVNASKAIEDPDGRPVITPDDGNEPEKPDVIETKTGTLAFEDIWPDGGDYDMNDVIVEYNCAVSFDKKNQVTKIVDTFTPVHDGAVFANAFAYQIDKGQFGKITSSATTEGIRTETETSSIIVCPNVKQAARKVYTVTREFASGSFNKKDFKSYNPYIIVKYVEGQRSRTEVHLPKHEATSFADLSLIGSGKDAYYVDKAGAYPFAIDIPIVNFIPVTEKSSIDTEYPYFKAWADSKGKEYTDWYKSYKK